MTAVMQINIISLLVTMNTKIKKTTGQIKILMVTVKQRIRLVLYILCVNEFNVFVQVLLLHGFIYNISRVVK